MNPKVTVIIPTFNQAQFILEAVESALFQSYENIEIVISDDCSTDNTREVLQEVLLDKRVKYFKNSNNIGRVNNYRKTLIERATGEWVVNLDGDDYFTDNEFIIRAIRNIDIIGNNRVLGYLTNKYIDLAEVNRTMAIEKIDKQAYIVDGRGYFINYYNIGGFAHMSFVYERKKAIELCFYEYDYLASDFISFMKLLLHGNIILSNYEIGVWRKHKNNASQKNLYKKYNENILVTDVIAKYASLFLTDRILQTWKNAAFNNNRETLVMDLIHHARGWKQLSLILSNFKLRKVYFILLVKFVLRKKF